MQRREFPPRLPAMVASLMVSTTGLACVVGDGGGGARYLGFVTDKDGKPVTDATVLVTSSNAELKVDREGRFVFTDENFESDQPTTLFICRKPGFRSVRAQKRVSTRDQHLVLVTCTLEREK